MASEDDHCTYLAKATTLKLIKHYQKMQANNMAYSRISLNHTLRSQGNYTDFEKISSDAIANSWAIVYFPLVIPSISSLVRCMAFRSFVVVVFAIAFTTD